MCCSSYSSTNFMAPRNLLRELLAHVVLHFVEMSGGRRLPNSTFTSGNIRYISRVCVPVLNFRTAKSCFGCAEDVESGVLDWTQCHLPSSARRKGEQRVALRGTCPGKGAFRNLEDGATVENFLEWFPGVKREQVQAVLGLPSAVWQSRERFPRREDSFRSRACYAFLTPEASWKSAGREAKRNHRNQHQQRIPPRTRTGRRKPAYLRFLRPSGAHSHWGVSPVVGARWARFTTEEAAGKREAGVGRAG